MNKNKLAEKLGVDPIQYLKHHFDLKNDRAVVDEIADILDVQISPVNRIHELEDSSDKLYLWDLDCTDEQCVELAQKIKNKYIKTKNRDPNALHIVRNDIQGVEEMSPAQVREIVEPWLNQEAEK